MPSMFSRRRGASTSSRNAPLDSNTAASATLAASQAFSQRNTSSTSLSSAAAAAALRSLTSSPEPVGNIQTKRMMRRGSQTSIGSASVIGAAGRGGTPVGRPGIQRTNSNGSMTERTFRSPSPGGRPNGNGRASVDIDAPPVPAIPANVSYIRPASTEPPARMMSPPPQRGRRGASVDRARQPPPSTPQSNKRLSNVSEQAAGSVNFSRPMSPSFGSPTSPASPTGAASKYTHTGGSWHTGATGAAANVNGQQRASAGIAQDKVDRIMAGVGSSSTRSVSSKQGSHLAQATNGQVRPSSAQSARPSGPNDYEMVYDPSSRTFIQKPKAPKQAPASPQFVSSKPDPGVWDPHTRTFIQRQTRSATASPVPPPATVKQAKPRPVLTPVETELEPPPKNPARYSPVPHSPSSPRADGLHRQPSVIHEDPEKEARTDASTLPKKSPARAISPLPATARASQALERVVSLEVPQKSEAAARTRNASISPQRSAHFSPSPVLEATRHNPPPRDFSPAKSAMKHSPSSSVRAISPMAFVKAPASDISDTVSDVGSQDGSLTASGTKKKKSVRVSFDEHAQTVPATSAQPITPPTEDEEEAFMKPRPALPSFGSVRSGGRVQPEPAEKVTEMPPERHDVSSDHAIGGILKEKSTRNANEPLPPEVTSKEGAGYASDTDSEADHHVAKTVTATSTLPAESTASLPAVQETVPVNLPDPQESEATKAQKSEAEVPAITLLPPTPGLDEDSQQHLDESENDVPVNLNRSSMEGIVVPGGWGSTDDTATARDLGISNLSADAGEDSEPTQHLSDINEDETDEDAEFSDAAEDLSELDDGGFASLDAIVQSPMVTPSKNTEIKEVPETVDRSAEETDDEDTPTKPVAAAPTEEEIRDAAGPSVSDWSEATAYWSQLSRSQRRQMELEHLQPEEETKPSAAAAVKKTTTTKKSQPAASTTTTKAKEPVAVAAASKTQPKPQPKTQQPLKPALKKSMRAEPEPALSPSNSVQMRQSMRSSAPASATSDNTVQMRQSMRSSGSLRASGSMAKTMRGPSAPGGGEARSRPTSTASLPASAVGAAGASTAAGRPSVDSLASVEAARPKIQKKTSQTQQTVPLAQQQTPSARLAKELAKADDSDSESSFKKRRRARAGSTSTVESQGRYSMKRSMRGATASPPPPLPTDRRPTSPTPSSRGKSSLLRSLSPTGSLFSRKKMPPPASEPQRTTLRSSSVPRGGSSATMRSTPSAAASKPTKKYKSRFADSDDEDDDAPRGGFFRSRFADSDDDEPLTPVRGIPRRPGQTDGDSTDLDDSDEDYSRKGSRRQKAPKPVVPSSAEIDAAMAAARRNLGMAEPEEEAPKTQQEGIALSKGSLRVEDAQPPSTPQTVQSQQQSPQPRPSLASTPDKNRRSFLGSILRRNRGGSSASIPQVPSTNNLGISTNGPNSPTPVGSPAVPSSPASPARAKLVRKNSNQPRTVSGTSAIVNTSSPIATTNTTAADTSADPRPSTADVEIPTPHLDFSDWPLSPPPIPDDEPSAAAGANRPNTSDGIGSKLTTMRPNLARRSVSGQQPSRSPSNSGAVAQQQHRTVRIMAGEEGSEPGERAKDLQKNAAVGGKKKKFGMLRRAFKLDD